MNSRTCEPSPSFVPAHRVNDGDEPVVPAPERSSPGLSIEDAHRLRIHRPVAETAANVPSVETARLAEILSRAYRNERLTTAENLRLENFYFRGLADMARAFRDAPEAELPLERWRQIYAMDARFRNHWQQQKAQLNERFVRFFEALIASQTPDKFTAR